MAYIREKDLYLYHPDEMYHHGIKGMKWGVRRFQDKSGRRTAAGKERYSEDKSNRLKLTDKQKKYVKSFDKNKPIKDLINGVNPTKSNTNCRACAASTALRMMGIDAEALNIPGGKTSEVINGCFKNAKIIEMYEPSKDKIVRNMQRRFKDGDFGIISATIRNYRGEANAHAFNWKIENGVPKFFDGQQNLEDSSFYLDAIMSNKVVEFAKINDLELNLDNLFNFINLKLRK